MDGYLQVCLIIVIASILSGFISGHKDKIFIKESLLYAGVYYYAVSAIRMLQGHSTELLGHAMKDKTITGYLKMLAFIVASWIVIYLIRRINKVIINDILEKAVSIFWLIQILTVICYDIPVLKLTVIEGLIAVFVAVLIVLSKKQYKEDTNDNIYKRTAFISLLAWSVMHALTAPTEIYAYNTQDFVYRYKDFMPDMLLIVACMAVMIYLLITQVFTGIQNRVLCIIAFSYTLLSYVQTMFLNGDMNVMEGVSQNWSDTKIYANVMIWILAIIVIAILAYKKIGFYKICIYTSAVLIALQLLGMASLLITGELFNEDKVQLSEEKAFELGNKENVIVFVLDTYDVQMIDLVEKEDPDFLIPLNDFTLYDNMVSRFGYTSGSLPYLLTGILTEDYTQKEYDDSTFLRDMKADGIDIRLITEQQYVNPFDKDLVDNMSDDWSVSMEIGKTVSQMIRCARYRGVPFILKEKYQYNELDLASCIDRADFYLFSNDQVFYEDMTTEKVSVSNEYAKAFRLYHIYGAHSPYYFRENMTYDYSSQQPIKQWRAALKIVYEYLEEMKAAGCYDDSTIIIMADHGPNDKQRASLEKMNISINENLRPIFFIKRAGESHDSYVRDHRETSHDDFCATVMRSFDDNRNTYGIPVWERQ